VRGNLYSRENLASGGRGRGRGGGGGGGDDDDDDEVERQTLSSWK